MDGRQRQLVLFTKNLNARVAETKNDDLGSVGEQDQVCFEGDPANSD